MKKLKIGLSSLNFPVSMARYMWSALERRSDVEVFMCGPHYDDWIPWAGGINLPHKYVKHPHCPIPVARGSRPPEVPYEFVELRMPKDLDLFLTIDAGWRFTTRPKADVVGLIKTDPHAISKEDYYIAARHSDFVWTMQTPYREHGDYYLPYAFDPEIHYPMDLEPEYDVAMIGLQYQHRVQLQRELERKGYKVAGGIGIVYDEYREMYNKSKIAVSWSSKLDLPTRVFEAMGMLRPLVANRVPDMVRFFEEGDHYLAFDGIEEAVWQIEWLLEHYDAAELMAKTAYAEVINKHSWDHRMEQVLRESGVLCG